MRLKVCIFSQSNGVCHRSSQKYAYRSRRGKEEDVDEERRGGVTVLIKDVHTYGEEEEGDDKKRQRFRTGRVTIEVKSMRTFKKKG